jgi:hypothetical protein
MLPLNCIGFIYKNNHFLLFALKKYFLFQALNMMANYLLKKSYNTLIIFSG